MTGLSIAVDNADFGKRGARGISPAYERLSLADSMTSQARAHSATGLWLLQIGALVFVALGILMLVLDPGNWPVALGSIVFFGFCAGCFVFLQLRKAGLRS